MKKILLTTLSLLFLFNAVDSETTLAAETSYEAGNISTLSIAPDKIWVTQSLFGLEGYKYWGHNFYGAYYRGYLTNTLRNDGGNWWIYEGYVYRSDYNGGSLPIPSKNPLQLQ